MGRFVSWMWVWVWACWGQDTEDHTTNLFDHRDERLLFVIPELLVVLTRLHVELVSGLRLRGLEGAGEDGDLGVVQVLVHLRMAHVLVEQHALYQDSILHLATDLQ